MRVALAACLALAFVGCANTIQRLDGEIPITTGPARTACEKAEWLVMAPTSYEVVSESTKTSTTHSDGAGLYRVGGRDPESIPDLAPALGESDDMVLRKTEEVSPHDRDQIIAMTLGGAGIVAIGIGVAVFVSSFDSVDDGDGGEDQEIDGTGAIAGGVTVGAGFILGVIAVAVSPNHGERAQADASRFVFNPRQDDPRKVKALVERHNAKVRQRCEAAGQVGADDPQPPPAPPTTDEAAPWLGEGAAPADGSPGPTPGDTPTDDPEPAPAPEGAE